MHSKTDFRTVKLSIKEQILKRHLLFVVPQVILVNAGVTRRLDLVVDTGATYVTVSPEIFEQLKIKTDNCIPVYSATSVQKSRVGRVDTIIANGVLKSENVKVAVMPFPEHFIAEGLLGMSFLRYFPFLVDCPQKKIEFWLK